MRNLSFRFWVFAGEHNFQTSRAAIFEEPDIDADYTRDRNQLLIREQPARLKSIMEPPSYGCVRLANWDVVRLATKIKSGDIVSIR